MNARATLEVCPALDTTTLWAGHDATSVTLGLSRDRFVVGLGPGNTRILRHQGGAPVTLDVAVQVQPGTRALALGRDRLALVEPQGRVLLLGEHGAVLEEVALSSPVLDVQAQPQGQWWVLDAHGTMARLDVHGVVLEQQERAWSAFQCVAADVLLGVTQDGILQRVEHGTVTQQHALHVSHVTAVAQQGAHLVAVSQPPQGGMTFHLGALGHKRFIAWSTVGVVPQADGRVAGRGDLLAWRTGNGVCVLTVEGLR